MAECLLADHLILFHWNSQQFQQQTHLKMSIIFHLVTVSRFNNNLLLLAMVRKASLLANVS